ncbi:MAG: aspartate/glutamate racemase family protein [Clostridia bacterium]|nr:aspartate/glutamate racemase family protein [Clostridia bacterium]
MRIGFFDSGIGGLTTLKTSVELLGGGDYVYLADDKRAPYGLLDGEQLYKIGKTNVEYLIRLGCECVVIGCNTMTAVVKKRLETVFPNIYIVGTEPAVLPAVKENLKVALLATPVTAGSTRIRELLDMCRGKVTVYPTSSLAGIIENSDLDSVFLEKYVKNNLKQLNEFDAVVLGCTHYVYLTPYIQKIYPHIKIYDGNLGVASRLKSLVGEQNTRFKCLFLSTTGKQNQKLQNIFSKI